MYYHGSPEKFETVTGDDFCITDDMHAAASYGENVHRFSYSGKTMSERQLVNEFEQEIRDAGGQVYMLLDSPSFRALMVADGWDGVEFCDYCEHGKMNTIRVLNPSTLTFDGLVTDDELWG